jgi:four helix bundle protein
MPTYYTYSFEKLDVWQKARELKVAVYKIGNQFPSDERYGLLSQIKRASGSITANLAEGSGRATYKDRAHFTNLAYASGLEVIDHIITAKDLGFIDDNTYTALRLNLDEILNKLNKLHKAQIRRKDNLLDQRGNG